MYITNILFKRFAVLPALFNSFCTNNMTIICVHNYNVKEYMT